MYKKTSNFYELHVLGILFIIIIIIIIIIMRCKNKINKFVVPDEDANHNFHITLLFIA